METLTAARILPPGPSRQATRLTRLGDWMAVHRRTILTVQCFIVTIYLTVVVVPAFLPHPQADARLLPGDSVAMWQDRLVLFAQYLFWGVWWPFTILSIMLVGRVWCGVLCPEGALTEFASRHGRGLAIPKWLRWSGWPPTAFVLTTLYGQLVSVYEYPQAALLILGGSSVAAVVIGYLYGKGKRVWCRYLCPVTGVFALLARLAPVYFRVDRAAWDAVPQRTMAVDCAPLLDVKHLRGNAQCHSCGRCSGHRNAVTLAWRSPQAEILGGATPSTIEALLLIFGMLGVALGAFQWTVSPWFVQIRQQAAEWLVNADILWPLADCPSWWLLTSYPEVHDVFTWLDGAAILAYIGAVAVALGGTTLLAVCGAARLAGVDWQRLALCLTPLGGIGLFLGLSMMTVTHLRAEGLAMPWLGALRGVLLGLGVLWSAWLGLQMMRTSPSGWVGASRRSATCILWMAPLIAVGASWILVFYVW